MQWAIFITGIATFIMHGFFPSLFQLDWFSLLVLFVLSIPILAPYLKKAKVPGAEFEFKDEIRGARRLVQISVEKAQKKFKSSPSKKPLPFETFKLSAVKELLDSDPTLALAALRIEIERRIRILVSTQTGKSTSEYTTLSLVDLTRKIRVLSSEQFSALKKIISICNKAIHGASVSKSEAEEIIGLTEQLNGSFSTGYSIDLSVNTEYEKQGLLCEWEHCIELMPLSEKPTKLSCPVFGHNCPGGLVKVSSCDRTIAEIPKSRFIKKLIVD